ncbi:hypothetical protein RCL_jg4740.t1 [Rhizophagus clarus]|uniref:Uncharacterized protein n=1 Tax=Rhizophagus clarus TaxID=94130 RepID=A0A8H3L496_9GLOM|nr:hypothetical protein RCL_jg4740.t1 [Rhizophagus clarus]
MNLSIYEEISDIITLNSIIKKLGFKSYFKIFVDRDEDIYNLKVKILKEQGKHFQAFDIMNLKYKNWYSVCLREFVNNDAFWDHMTHVQYHFDSKSGKISWKNNIRKIKINNKREQTYKEIIPVKKPRESRISKYIWYSSEDTNTSN